MAPRQDLSRSLAAKRASCGDPSGDNRPPFLQERRIRQIEYNMRGRVTFPSRFYHQETMQALGADDHIRTMFRNIGWEGFLGLHGYTYHSLTRNFLESYAYDLNQRILTFKLMGIDYQVTFDQVNDAFGIDRSQPLMDRFSKPFFNFKQAAKTEFWHHITNSRSNFHSKLRDHHIIHPIWILAHRVLTGSITVRKEFGQVNKQDIFFLYAMYKKIRVDFCDFFLERCDTIRGRKLGDVGVGGLVTILAIHAGLDPSTITESKNTREVANFLTLECLDKKFGLIKQLNDVYWNWYTVDPNDTNAKHPCFRIPHAIMSKFRPSTKSTWKPAFHYPVTYTIPSGIGESSGTRAGEDEDSDSDDEVMEEAEGGEEEEEEHVNVGGGYEEMTQQQEEDTIPLSLYQQMASLRTDFNTFSHDTNHHLGEQDTHIGQLLQGHNQLLLSQNQILQSTNQIQESLQFMMNQGHDVWSHMRPAGGYTSYPPPQPPQDPFYPYPPPPYGYPPYSQYPPPGGYGSYPPYPPPPGGAGPSYPPPGGPQ